MKPYSIFVLITVFTFSNCIPTSVLANTKDPTDQKQFKGVQQDGSGKPNNDLNSGSETNPSAALSSNLKSNQNVEIQKEKFHGNEIPQNVPDPIISGLFMSSHIVKEKPAPHKRGISSQFLYGGNNNGNNDAIDMPSLPRSYPNYIPNGMWSSELDPISSIDFQDIDDYPRGQYSNSHSKPYDSLQNILNSEPVALPYQYAAPYGYNRYYNERRKRSNKHSSYDDPNPEYTELELTPDELLALLAMIEAGAIEKEQQNAVLWDNVGYDANNNRDYQPMHKPAVSYYDDHNEIGSFMMPNKMDENDFDARYQIPISNFDNVPRYDILKENKGQLRGGQQAKRFMVSKKKRSTGHLFNGPIGKPGISFSPIKGAKSISRVL